MDWDLWVERRLEGGWYFVKLRGATCIKVIPSLIEQSTGKCVYKAEAHVVPLVV